MDDRWLASTPVARGSSGGTSGCIREVCKNGCHGLRYHWTSPTGGSVLKHCAPHTMNAVKNARQRNGWRRGNESRFTGRYLYHQCSHGARTTRPRCMPHLAAISVPELSCKQRTLSVRPFRNSSLSAWSVYVHYFPCLGENCVARSVTEPHFSCVSDGISRYADMALFDHRQSIC